METLLIAIAIAFIISVVIFFLIQLKRKVVTPPVVNPPVTTPTVPVIGNHIYEVTGRWSKDDVIHRCPEKCGFVIYKDHDQVIRTLQGVNIDENGFENPITIRAYEIIARAGVNLEIKEDEQVKQNN